MHAILMCRMQLDFPLYWLVFALEERKEPYCRVKDAVSYWSGEDVPVVASVPRFGGVQNWRTHGPNMSDVNWRLEVEPRKMLHEGRDHERYT